MELVQDSYTAEQKIKIETLENRIKELEKQVLMLKEQELNILNSLPAPIIVCDFYEQIIFLNKAMRTFLGYTVENTYQLRDILPADSLHQLRRKYFQLFKNNDPLFIKSFKILTANREEKIISVAISKYYYHFEQVGFVGLAFMPAEMFESSLIEQNKSLLKFISIIAHDLRNPFNSLIGFTNLLIENYDSYSDDKIKEYIHHLYTASSQGFQLLDNLLEWSRVTTGSITPSPIVFNIDSVIDNVIKLLEPTILKKEISLKSSITPGITVNADPNMIQTAIRNILSNAIKFTHRQGNIEVLVSKVKNQAVIEIKDDGVGMSPSTLKNLFKIGQIVSSKGTEGEKGTGMGLLLCKEFIELNKGKISVQSTINKGSTFKIKLPLA